ncbi:MAG: ABC transporter substrate-binding protein [Spirochaetaceae bacterium]
MLKKMLMSMFLILLSASVIFASGQNETNETVIKSDSDNFTIKVSSWNLGDEPSGIIKSYKESFEKIYKEKYPNATIEIINTPGEKYFDVLKAQMASNSAADVVQYQGTETALFAQAGFLADLSDMSVVDNISVLEPVSYDGKVYGIPFDTGSWGVWYSKKIFKENNISVPVTWDEFLAACEKIKGLGITPIAGGFLDSWIANMTVSVFRPNDYGTVDYELDLYNGSKKIAGPEMEKTFRKLQIMIDNVYFGEDALSNGWDLQRNGFENGKSAMIIHGSYMAGLANIETADQGGMETGFFAIPNDTGKPLLGVGVGMITGVNSKTDDLERAKDLVAAMNSAEAIVVRMKDAGMFPAINGIEIDYKETGNKEFLQVLGSSETVSVNRFIPGSVTDLTGQIFTKMLSGQTFDPEWLNNLDSTYLNDKSLLAPPQ